MFTVVIPLYNKEHSIAHTLKGVLAQTFQDFEIVIVDDGSTDNSANVVKQFTDERIHLIHQENAGVSAARNKGIAEAKGEYIAFLDADDEWLPNHLEELNNLIVEFPQCKARCTSYMNNLAGNESRVILNKMLFSSGKGILTNYFEVASCSHPPIWTSAVCADKDLLLQIGGFPVGVTNGEDLLTWARIVINTDAAFSWRATAIYMLGEGYDYTNLPPRDYDNDDPVGKGLIALLNQKYDRKKELRHYIGRFYKMKASVYLRYGEHGKSIVNCLKSFYYRPLALESYIILLMAVMPMFIVRKIIKMHKY
ncbi:MAG: glycosyltransferase family 2 protein [Bacteroidaceae bacterium]|nr:glycosyltransferase family 2 protein [Bacteroidaceae bacterium]